MSDVREILIPCAACGHKTSTTVAQWSEGFPCSACGATIARPKQGGAPPVAESAPPPPPMPVPARTPTLKQAPPVSTGIGLPTSNAAPPPVSPPTRAADPTATRSVQLRQAERRADELTADFQALQQTNQSQQRSIDTLMDENRELKTKLQRVTMERQSAELDVTAQMQRLKAENQVVREKFDELIKERVQLRSNLTLLESRCHRLEQEGGSGVGGGGGSARQAAESTVLKRKLAESRATEKAVREKFEQIQQRYRDVKAENEKLAKRVTDLEMGSATTILAGPGEHEAAVKGLRTRLEREQRKVDELEGQNREMMDQTLKLEVEVGVLRDQLSDAQKMADDLRAAADHSAAIDAVRAEAQAAIEAAERKAARAAESQSALQAEAETHRNQVDALQQELQESRDMETALDQRLQEIHRREETLSKSLRQAEADLANLQDRLVAAESGGTQDDLIQPEEMERLKARLQELESERASIVSAERKSDEQIEGIRVENQILREKLDEMIAEAAKQDAAPQETLVRLEIENKLLREKLDELLGPVKAEPPKESAEKEAAPKDEATEKPDKKDGSEASQDAAGKGGKADNVADEADKSESKAAADASKEDSGDAKPKPKGIKKKAGAGGAEAKRRALLAKKLQRAKAEAAKKQEGGS